MIVGEKPTVILNISPCSYTKPEAKANEEPGYNSVMLLYWVWDRVKYRRNSIKI